MVSNNATPLELIPAEPIEFPPSRKVTTPPDTAAVLVTVALRRIVLPANTVEGVAVNAVTVVYVGRCTAIKVEKLAGA